MERVIRRTHSFTAELVDPTTKNCLEVRCLFFDDKRDISPREFFAEAEAELKACATHPDAMVFLGSSVIVKDLWKHWNDFQMLKKDFIERGVVQTTILTKSYYFFEWSNFVFNLIGEELLVSSNSRITSSNLNALLFQGVSQLVRENQVVQYAPTGHVFRHPSGTVNNIFIQARELAKSEPQLCFVANILAAFISERANEAQIVFIDTMSIYSYVKEMLHQVNSKARVLSFHSYDELDKLLSPTVPYCVVISASTSGGMAERLINEQNFCSQSVYTLIDLTGKNRAGKVLFALDKHDFRHELKESTGDETEIELGGEHFVQKAKPPRQVVIGELHSPSQLIDILDEFGGGGIPALRSSISSSGARRVVSADGLVVARSVKLKNWIVRNLSNDNHIYDRIIYTNDQASLELAQFVSDHLKASELVSAVIPHDELENVDFANARGILILSAVCGNGRLLRNISRALREFAFASTPRHFLVGLCLPDEDTSWTNLEQFLARSHLKGLYAAKAWHILPIGVEGPSSAWDQAKELAAKADVVELNNLCGADLAVVEAAIKQFTTVLNNPGSPFLPKANGNLLNLTNGFRFFGDVYKDDINRATHADTYWAIASVLQAARDFEDDARRLKPNGYESVVFGTECWGRFNDSLLQACWLRACKPSELDYSASDSFSQAMADIIKPIFEAYDEEDGACAPEFALALATGRMKLKGKHQRSLVETTIAKIKDKPSILLGLLILSLN